MDRVFQLCQKVFGGIAALALLMGVLSAPIGEVRADVSVTIVKCPGTCTAAWNTQTNKCEIGALKCNIIVLSCGCQVVFSIDNDGKTIGCAGNSCAVQTVVVG